MPADDPLYNEVKDILLALVPKLRKGKVAETSDVKELPASHTIRLGDDPTFVKRVAAKGGIAVPFVSDVKDFHRYLLWATLLAYEEYWDYTPPCIYCGQKGVCTRQGWADFLKRYLCIDHNAVILSCKYEHDDCPNRKKGTKSASFFAHHPKVLQQLPDYIKFDLPFTNVQGVGAVAHTCADLIRCLVQKGGQQYARDTLKEVQMNQFRRWELCYYSYMGHCKDLFGTATEVADQPPPPALVSKQQGTLDGFLNKTAFGKPPAQKPIQKHVAPAQPQARTAVPPQPAPFGGFTDRDGYRAFCPVSARYYRQLFLGAFADSREWQQQMLEAVVDPMGMYASDHCFKNAKKVVDETGHQAFRAIFSVRCSSGKIAAVSHCASEAMADALPTLESLHIRAQNAGKAIVWWWADNPDKVERPLKRAIPTLNRPETDRTVLLDLGHQMARYRKTFVPVHPLAAAAMADLSQAYVDIIPGDEERVLQRYIDRGLKQKPPIPEKDVRDWFAAKDFAWRRERCRVTIHPPDKLADKVDAWKEKYSTCGFSVAVGSWLFTELTDITHENQLKHIRDGFLSDPPNVPMYFFDINGNSHSRRGTSGVETWHAPYNQLPTGNRCAVDYFLALESDHTHKWNIRSGIQNEGEQDFGVYDLRPLMATRQICLNEGWVDPHPKLAGLPVPGAERLAPLPDLPSAVVKAMDVHDMDKEAPEADLEEADDDWEDVPEPPARALTETQTEEEHAEILEEGMQQMQACLNKLRPSAEVVLARVGVRTGDMRPMPASAQPRDGGNASAQPQQQPVQPGAGGSKPGAGGGGGNAAARQSAARLVAQSLSGPAQAEASAALENAALDMTTGQQPAQGVAGHDAARHSQPACPQRQSASIESSPQGGTALGGDALTQLPSAPRVDADTIDLLSDDDVREGGIKRAERTPTKPAVDPSAGPAAQSPSIQLPKRTRISEDGTRPAPSMTGWPPTAPAPYNPAMPAAATLPMRVQPPSMAALNLGRGAQQSRPVPQRLPPWSSAGPSSAVHPAATTAAKSARSRNCTLCTAIYGVPVQYTSKHAEACQHMQRVRSGNAGVAETEGLLNARGKSLFGNTPQCKKIDLTGINKPDSAGRQLLPNTR